MYYRWNFCHPMNVNSIKLLLTHIFKSGKKLLADQHRCTGGSSLGWQEEEWWQCGWEDCPHLMTFCSTQWNTVRGGNYSWTHDLFLFVCVSGNTYLLHNSTYCPVAIAILLSLFRGGHLRQKHSVAHSPVWRTTEHTPTLRKCPLFQ